MIELIQCIVKLSTPLSDGRKVVFGKSSCEFINGILLITEYRSGVPTLWFISKEYVEWIDNYSQAVYRA